MQYTAGGGARTKWKVIPMGLQFQAFVPNPSPPALPLSAVRTHQRPAQEPPANRTTEWMKQQCGNNLLCWMLGDLQFQWVTFLAFQNLITFLSRAKTILYSQAPLSMVCDPFQKVSGAYKPLIQAFRPGWPKLPLLSAAAEAECLWGRQNRVSTALPILHIIPETGEAQLELNCSFTIFPCGKLYIKNLSLSCSLDTKASYIFKAALLGGKNILPRLSKDMSYPLPFQWDQLFCDSTAATAWKRHSLGWQILSVFATPTAMARAVNSSCILPYSKTFFPSASLEHSFSKEKKKKTNNQKSVFQFTVKWRKITQCTAAWSARRKFSL